ncbi:MAG: hypothetical protein AABP62_12260 [Planctomycetota bacterium]
MSKPVLNAEQVRAWKAGQDAANRREIEELRKTPTRIKLQQLAAMMCSDDLFRSPVDREAEVLIARQRWLKVYRAYGH